MGEYSFGSCPVMSFVVRGIELSFSATGKNFCFRVSVPPERKVELWERQTDM
jgi:hypothetical protein